MSYTVKKIQEADYGCEERPVGYEPQVIIRLCDENNHEIELEVADAYLYANDIKVGDKVTLDRDGRICKEGASLDNEI